MMYPLVYSFATRKFEPIPVVVTCRILGFSKQGYYFWLKNLVTDRDWEQAHMINVARNVNKENPGFGYRFIGDELQHQGFSGCERTVWRLCSTNNVKACFMKNRRNKTSKTLPPARDDLVKRNFKTTGVNRLWLTDITEHPTKTGKIYMCAVKDMFSRKIVGYCIDDNMKASLAINALENAIRNRKPVGTIIHSDRGAQFQSKQFKKLLTKHSLVGSMGQVGAAGEI